MCGSVINAVCAFADKRHHLTAARCPLIVIRFVVQRGPSSGRSPCLFIVCWHCEGAICTAIDKRHRHLAPCCVLVFFALTRRETLRRRRKLCHQYSSGCFRRRSRCQGLTACYRVTSYTNTKCHQNWSTLSEIITSSSAFAYENHKTNGPKTIFGSPSTHMPKDIKIGPSYLEL